jgi:photosystem II stability/assembly factor-like uncharacterized protein
VDGGVSWRSIGDRSMTSVCFLDARNGWGADGKQIFKTTDAGRTWTEIADLAVADKGPWYPTIRCADATNARIQITEPYAALGHAPYLVFRTNDGGKTWLLEYRELYTLGQSTPSDIPQLGSYPSIIDTFRDGSTWVVTCTPPMDSQGFLVLSRAGSVTARGVVPFASCVNDASFVDAQHGWIIGPVYRPEGTESVVVRTRDTAGSWERVYPP